MRPRTAALLVLLVVGATSGCGGSPASGASSLTVFAAASLTDAVDELSDSFREVRPDVEVVTNLAGSQQLAAQLLSGAPADVFLSADATQMQRVADAGLLAGDPQALTSNRLVIAVPESNPRDIAGLDDIADPGLRLVVAAEEVPVGRYTRELLDIADVQLEPDSVEPDVRSALAKVSLDEADAAVVYATDATAAAGEVDAVPLPRSAGLDIRYVGAALADSAAPTLAADFIGFVASPAGQQILGEHGFVAPEPAA